MMSDECLSGLPGEARFYSRAGGGVVGGDPAERLDRGDVAIAWFRFVTYMFALRSFEM